MLCRTLLAGTGFTTSTTGAGTGFTTGTTGTGTGFAASAGTTATSTARAFNEGFCSVHSYKWFISELAIDKFVSIITPGGQQ